LPILASLGGPCLIGLLSVMMTLGPAGAKATTPASVPRTSLPTIERQVM
jgi:hypothetical protein